MWNISSARRGLFIFASVLFGSFAIATAAANAATYSVFFSFIGKRHGGEPTGKLLFDNSGDILGAAAAGAGGGVIFELSPTAQEKVLFNHFDHALADSGVIADSSGNLYGTTFRGGGGHCGGRRKIVGCGTVYKLSPTGTETILYSFQGGSDGFGPQGGLVADADGNLYGVTPYGGNGTGCYYGCGIVYRVAPDGTETVLHQFEDANGDGYQPYAGLIFDSVGNLYGTTESGGALGFGTVFKVTPDGTESIVYSFKGSLHGDGYLPMSEVIIDSAGNLYGTTYWGGTNGDGTVFKIATDGTETVLYSFTGGSDGANPVSGLALDSSGNLYGTTSWAGSTSCGQEDSCGSVFELSSDGTETTLHDFTGFSDGSQPHYTPTLYNGNLYGTTYEGGTNGHGNIFQVTLDNSKAH